MTAGDRTVPISIGKRMRWKGRAKRTLASTGQTASHPTKVTSPRDSAIRAAIPVPPVPTPEGRLKGGVPEEQSQTRPGQTRPSGWQTGFAAPLPGGPHTVPGPCSKDITPAVAAHIPPARCLPAFQRRGADVTKGVVTCGAFIEDRPLHCINRLMERLRWPPPRILGLSPDQTQGRRADVLFS